MAYQVAIIGSFQKYYNEILSIIKLFKQVGLYVLSPKESFISGKIEDFVVFDSDQKNYTPSEIQMITLEKILKADAVYVYNPNGYVGRTTCYEIGFCFSKKKPVYFYNYPNDLPIPIVENKQVLRPEVFASMVLQKDELFITDYNLCEEGKKSFLNIFELNEYPDISEKKKIVICGSMMFYDEMVKCQSRLKKLGIESIIPKEENDAVSQYSQEQFIDFKRKVSNAYLKKIRDKSTMGVLVYNAEKRGIPNYIGANTLVELAMAFMWNRKIFLLNDIYPPLKDELQAWRCICLKGDIDRINDEFVKEYINSSIETYQQMTIYDIM